VADNAYKSPYSDDLTYSNDCILFRRIRADWVRWNQTGPHGQWPRITSQAFQDYNEAMARRMGCPAPAMSVALAPVLEASGLRPEALLVGYPGYGLASITAQDARAAGQGITLWPNSEEPWHGLVFGLQVQVKSPGTRSTLAASAVWLILPARPQLS
jgi:hypothetical protein